MITGSKAPWRSVMVILVLLNSQIFVLKFELDLDYFRPYKVNYHIVYDGKCLKWNNNYVELQNVFENIVGVSGK